MAFKILCFLWFSLHIDFVPTPPPLSLHLYWQNISALRGLKARWNGKNDERRFKRWFDIYYNSQMYSIASLRHACKNHLKCLM